MTSDDEDWPSTEMDDDEYAEFVEREFDSEGRPKKGPPIGWILLAIVVVLLVLVMFWTR